MFGDVGIVVLCTTFANMERITAYGCTADRWISGWMDVLCAASM